MFLTAQRAREGGKHKACGYHWHSGHVNLDFKFQPFSHTVIRVIHIKHRVIESPPPPIGDSPKLLRLTLIATLSTSQIPCHPSPIPASTYKEPIVGPLFRDYALQMPFPHLEHPHILSRSSPPPLIYLSRINSDIISTKLVSKHPIEHEAIETVHLIICIPYQTLCQPHISKARPSDCNIAGIQYSCARPPVLA